MQCRQNVVLVRVEVRNRPERNGDEMERIYRKHTENQLDIFLFTAQLMGGGEIEEIAQSADKLSSCLKRSLTSVPIF